MRQRPVEVYLALQALAVRTEQVDVSPAVCGGGRMRYGDVIAHALERLWPRVFYLQPFQHDQTLVTTYDALGGAEVIRILPLFRVSLTCFFLFSPGLRMNSSAKLL